MGMHSLKDMVKGTTAKLAYCSGGKLYYQIDVEDSRYTFPIDVRDTEEVGGAIFNLEEKAMLFMRYIRKAIKNEELRFEKI